MRKGFTMIELIFVIVILGILAAVAIPKLTATRDDATVARATSDVATAIQDIASFYTARGNFGTNWTDMTNVQLGGSATSGVGETANYNVGTTTDCVTFTVTSADGNMTVGANTTAGRPCSDVVGLLTDRNVLGTAGADKVHVFGGSGVHW